MSFPFYIEIGSSKILLHTITEPLGMFIGFRYFLFLRKKQGDIVESISRIWVLIGAIFGALLGSRLVGGFENPQALFEAENPLLYIYQNKTVLGGFLGGLFGVEAIKKVVGEKQNTGDIFVYPILLALIIGRIGCFSMGIHEETYGLPTTFFTGMYLGDTFLRHPVTLYEIVFLIGLWSFLFLTEKKYVLTVGSRFKLFMIAYMVFRFLLDFIKPHYTFSIGLSTIQIASILGLLYYFNYLIKPKKFILQKK
ncbi:MAG: prolipoprotein diacylglyceryl transferase [Ferruginibacter sp.]|nr:prolipoprotein diacylglyceryl transferase [Ferruginibacter sp.]